AQAPPGHPPVLGKGGNHAAGPAGLPGVDPTCSDVLKCRFLLGRRLGPTLGAAVEPSPCAVARRTGALRRTSVGPRTGTIWPTHLTRSGIAGPRGAGVGDAVIDLIADKAHAVGVTPRRQRC